MELTPNKQKDESCNFFFASFFNRKTEITTLCSKQNLDFIKVDSTEIKNLLKDINIHKSSGPDGIGNLLLRNCSSSVTFLYQTIMNKGTYPTYWKVSEISPIFKDGNKSDLTCYRPISVLNCLQVQGTRENCFWCNIRTSATQTLWKLIWLQKKLIGNLAVTIISRHSVQKVW